MALGANSTHSKQTPALGSLEPCSQRLGTKFHPPPGPQQQANTSFEIPWTLQLATSGSSPTLQPQSGWAPALWHSGTHSQPCQELLHSQPKPQTKQHANTRSRKTRLCNHPPQNPALPHQWASISPGTWVPQPAASWLGPTSVQQPPHKAGPGKPPD